MLNDPNFQYFLSQSKKEKIIKNVQLYCRKWRKSKTLAFNIIFAKIREQTGYSATSSTTARLDGIEQAGHLDLAVEISNKLINP